MSSSGRSSASVPGGSIWAPEFAGTAIAQSVANDYYAIYTWIPTATPITGIAIGGSISSGGGTVTVGLCDHTGARVASSGTVALTVVNNQQQVPFSSGAYTPAPGIYYIEIIVSSAAAAVARGWTTAPVTNAAPQAALPASPIAIPAFGVNGRCPYVSTY
jgi:hypothetical protein